MSLSKVYNGLLNLQIVMLRDRPLETHSPWIAHPKHVLQRVTEESSSAKAGFVASKVGDRTGPTSGKLFSGLAMKISLSPDVERLIAERVGSGRYHSADEVVREGLELLQERENEARRSPSNHAANLATAFESIARDVPDADWESVPADLSKNVDYHLYGSRKTS
jgi:antitoxin ParD1/3/4